LAVSRISRRRVEPVFQLIPGLQHTNMGLSILAEWVSLEPQLQPVSMTMSMLRVSAGMT
jgi:hypothetical protein